MSSKKQRPQPTDEPLGFDVPEDDGAEAVEPPAAPPPATEPPAAAEPARQGNQPTCPKHNVQMVAFASNDMYTYYRCTVDTCRQRDKRVRPVGPLKNCYGHGASRGKP